MVLCRLRPSWANPYAWHCNLVTPRCVGWLGGNMRTVNMDEISLLKAMAKRGIAVAAANRADGSGACLHWSLAWAKCCGESTYDAVVLACTAWYAVAVPLLLLLLLLMFVCMHHATQILMRAMWRRSPSSSTQGTRWKPGGETGWVDTLGLTPAVHAELAELAAMIPANMRTADCKMHADVRLANFSCKEACRRLVD